MSKHLRSIHHKSPEFKVTSSDFFFNLIKSLKPPKYMNVRCCETENAQALVFVKLKPDNVCLFGLTVSVTHELINLPSRNLICSAAAYN